MRNIWWVGGAILLQMPAPVFAATEMAQKRTLSAPPAYTTTALQALPRIPSIKTLSRAQPTYLIELPEATSTLKAQVVSHNGMSPASRKALMLGVPRVIGPAQKTIDLTTATWTPSADGLRRTVRVDVRSPKAAALRLAYRWQGETEGVVLRFAAGSNVVEEVGAGVAGHLRTAQEAWSPVLDGETATLEIDVPVTRTPKATLELTRVSHLFAGGDALRKPGQLDMSLRRTADIGRSEACEVDLACNSDAALDDVANAVGKLVYTKEDGGTYLCTGTLLNNTGGQPEPYLFTARHCIESAPEAASLNVYWFFRAAACGEQTAPSMQLQTGGAQLLAASADWDWALLKMNTRPPEGVTYAAWAAQYANVQTPVLGLHHPKGDVLKRSDGFINRMYNSLSIGSSFIETYWRKGAIEQGSDGSPLLTRNSKGFYEVRGGLMFGYASCLPPDWDEALPPNYYSRLDRMASFVREYLAPNQPAPVDTAMVVEFYHRGLDHYFMSANPDEVKALDDGVHPGWERTGLRFMAYNKQVAGASPVCRYYMRPESGDSHFYSASSAECAEVGQRFAKDWIFESASVFYVPLPDTKTGVCPVDTAPVWRFFHETKTNHRYTAEVSVRDTLRVTPGWIAEGYGPDTVIMCTPAL